MPHLDDDDDVDDEIANLAEFELVKEITTEEIRDRT